jgi:hypothetical protein
MELSAGNVAVDKLAWFNRCSLFFFGGLTEWRARRLRR